MRGLDRASFIAAMTAELEQQQKNSGDLNAVPDISPSEVARKLHFDFPLVSSNDVNVLVDALETSGTTYPINISKRVLVNIVYLTQCRQASEDRAFAQAMSKLAASIYVSAPWRLLTMNRETLLDVFKSHKQSGMEDSVFVSDDDSSRSKGMVSWSDILDHFSDFVCSGSASYVCGTVTNDDGWCADNLQRSSHMENLCSLLSFMGDVMTFTFEKRTESSSLDEESFYTIMPNPGHDCDLKNALESRAKQVCGGGGGAPPVSARDQAFVSTIQKVWLHTAFLARDLLSQCPQLLERYLRVILAAMSHLSLPEQSSTYPTSCKCMQALVCSNLAVTICSHPTVEMQLVKSSSRESLRDFLSPVDDGVGDLSLAGLVDIFENMGRHSIDGGVEACSLLLDVSSLYLDGYDKRGAGVKLPAQMEAMHNHLLSSRALVTLVGFLDSFTKPSESSVDADDGLHKLQESSQVVKRLVQTLGKASLQSPGVIGSFILRLPSFGSSLHRMVGAWDTTSGGTSVPPIVMLPLLLALLITEERKSGASSPQFQSAFVLSVDMTVTRIEQSSVTTSESDQEDNDAIDEGNGNVERELFETESELKASCKVKAGQIPGLVSSLDTLLSKESGGYQALQRARGIPVLRDGLARICDAVKSSRTTNVDMRRLSKDLQALLEGLLKKTD